jgi:hypothetical protein
VKSGRQHADGARIITSFSFLQLPAGKSGGKSPACRPGFYVHEILIFITGISTVMSGRFRSAFCVFSVRPASSGIAS